MCHYLCGEDLSALDQIDNLIKAYDQVYFVGLIVVPLRLVRADL